MKRNYWFALSIIFTLGLNAQEIPNANCAKTCEIQEVVKENPYFGMQINYNCNRGFVRVMAVVPDSPISKFDVLKDDLIMKFDDTNVNSVQHFLDLIKQHKPDDVIKLTFMRNDKQVVTNNVALGALNTKVITKKVCCDDTAFSTNLKVYPVPTKDFVNIENSAIIGNYSLEVYDTNGRLITRFDENTTRGGISKSIDVSSYQAGTYLLRISNNDNVVTKQFVVTK